MLLKSMTIRNGGVQQCMHDAQFVCQTVVQSVASLHGSLSVSSRRGLRMLAVLEHLPNDDELEDGHEYDEQNLQRPPDEDALVRTFDGWQGRDKDSEIEA
jgi:hypothetical protein